MSVARLSPSRGSTTSFEENLMIVTLLLLPTHKNLELVSTGVTLVS